MTLRPDVSEDVNALILKGLQDTTWRQYVPLESPRSISKWSSAVSQNWILKLPRQELQRSQI
jgi:hypothetical protein